MLFNTNMRIAHLIMAHKDPKQLLRLIERLKHDHADIYVHIDKKIPINQFVNAVNHTNATFINNRIECNWGGNSFLKAIISSLNEVLGSGKNYDFINLISSQDYPLVSAQKMHEFFEKNISKNFISYETSIESEWWKSAVNRYKIYHFTDFNFKWKYFFQKIINKVMPARKLPGSITLFGSNKSSWWTISGECAKYVTQELADTSKFMRFLKYSWGSDEFAISTIIMNSVFKENVINDNLRYIDWSEKNAHPKILEINDFDKIINSGMLFARKFDIQNCSGLLDKIDQQCVSDMVQ